MKTYASITRHYGRYSCRRRGDRAKLSPPPAEEHESGYSREFRRSSWVACIKRIHEVDPLESVSRWDDAQSRCRPRLGESGNGCPKCKPQMRICAFIQDAHAMSDIMEAKGIADFRAPPPIPKVIDTSHAIDEMSSYNSFEPSPDDF